MKERISSIIERLPLGVLIGGRTQNTESEPLHPPPARAVGTTTFITDGKVNWQESNLGRGTVVRVNDGGDYRAGSPMRFLSGQRKTAL
ncbi:hypothetical protein CEXT_72611 [Caerostris extrusa]|uniref:Uncharacterized protein n=1 Tax=Caerostris extrusa TaxID=172846 RepID=A0AAV4RCX0_CAEEX|nr:hypothetical protein CEXT_72611 [Caerostris extrusa]